MSCRKIVPTAVLALSLAMALGFGQTTVTGATAAPDSDFCEDTPSQFVAGLGDLAQPVGAHGPQGSQPSDRLAAVSRCGSCIYVGPDGAEIPGRLLGSACIPCAKIP